MTICQIVFSSRPFGYHYKFEPTYCRGSVNALSHSLDSDPLAVGNLSPREQSEVKAAEFAYLCTQMNTHAWTRTDTHAQQCCVTWGHGLKKRLAGISWGIPIGGIRVGCQEREWSGMFRVHHAAPASLLTVIQTIHYSINCTINTDCYLQGKSKVILKDSSFWDMFLFTFLWGVRIEDW